MEGPFSTHPDGVGDFQRAKAGVYFICSLKAKPLAFCQPLLLTDEIVLFRPGSNGMMVLKNAWGWPSLFLSWHLRLVVLSIQLYSYKLYLNTNSDISVNWYLSSIRLSSVQLLTCVPLLVIPWTAACQVSLSITNSQSLLKLMSIKSVMPSNHLILCHPLLLPSILPSIKVFSSESVLRIR